MTYCKIKLYQVHNHYQEERIWFDPDSAFCWWYTVLASLYYDHDNCFICFISWCPIYSVTLRMRSTGIKEGLGGGSEIQHCNSHLQFWVIWRTQVASKRAPFVGWVAHTKRLKDLRTNVVVKPFDAVAPGHLSKCCLGMSNMEMIRGTPKTH